MKVQVYKNLHKQSWSVRSKGLVTGHTDQIILKDATFRVSPAGVRKFRATGVKTVHAYVSGEPVTEKDVPELGWMQVQYNPALFDTFVTVYGKPVHSARFVWFDFPLVFACI